METRLTNTCHQLRPGCSDFLLFPAAIVGFMVGGAVGSIFEGFLSLLALFGGVFGLPAFVMYLESKDGRLGDDDCRKLLEVAETASEQAFVREIYCEKGYFMKSDADRILERVKREQHVDLQRRMGATT